MVQKTLDKVSPKYIQILKKKSIKILLSLTFILGLSGFVVPLVAKHSLEKFLVENGAEEAKIESLWLNPFSGKIVVRGIDVQSKGKKLLSTARMEINIGVHSLLFKTINIERAIYDQLSIVIEQNEDGSLQIASYTTGAEKKKIKEPQDAQSSFSWIVLAKEVILSNCKVVYRTPELEMDVVIGHARLKKFTTADDDKTGQFELKGSVNGAPVDLFMDTLRVAPYLEVGGSVKVDKFLLKSVASLLENSLDTFEGKVSIKGRIEYLQKGEEQGVGYDGTLTLQDVGVGSSEGKLNGESVRYQGEVRYKNVAGAAPKVTGIAELTTQGVTLSLPENMQLVQKDLNLKIDGAVALVSPIAFTVNADLKTSETQLFMGVQEEPLLVVNQSKIVGVSAKNADDIVVEKMEAEGLHVAIQGEVPLEINVPDVEVAKINIAGLSTLSLKRLSVKGGEVVSSVVDKVLVKVENSTINEINFDKNQLLTANNLMVDEVYLFGSVSEEKQESLSGIKKIEFTSLRWRKESGFEAELLQFSDFWANLRRDSDGSINISSYLEEIKDPAFIPSETSVSSSENSSKQGVVKVGMVSLQGKNRVVFHDASLEMPFTSNIDIIKLEATGLDTGNRESKIDLELEALLEERAPLKTKAIVTPFGESLALEMDLDLKNYPLKNFSGYTAQFIGTALESGQLQITTKLAIAEEKLDMQNGVLLKRLKTKTLAKELSDKLDNELPIPLNSALSILRDSKGDISLNVPLDGPLADLDVGIADILITALSKAIVPAASSYLVYTLGPYGALAYVGMKVGEKIFQVQLPPVTFLPNEKKLVVEGDYLTRVAKILKDRPETDLQICPVSMSWELKTKKEIETTEVVDIPVEKGDVAVLTELGQQRAGQLKEKLASTYGIDEARLLICETKIETAKGEKPRITLYL